MIEIGLLGNPNVGKSTLFNRLTGLKQHTGNWPGKTVATAKGVYKWQGTQSQLVDLPGTYSLQGKSQEEEIAVEYIRSGEPQCTVVVCDGTCLERNLILALWALAETENVVICVNLLDEAKKKGISIDLEALETILGVPVVGTNAKGGRGMENLQSAIAQVVAGEWEKSPILIPETGKYLVIKAEDIANDVVSGKEPYEEKEIKWDKILTGRLTGLPLMLLLLMGVFWLTIKGANVPSQMIAEGLAWVGAWLKDTLTWLPVWVTAPLLDGVFATVSKVVAVMLPPMAIFFPLFTLLEDLGYLPRVAYVLDRPFARCHACGKQALTTCMGFGCNAAGVVGCRIVDSPRERLIAILTNAFVPCNGRFPALILLITIFIAPGGNGILSALALTGFVVLGVAMTLVASWVLGKTVLKGERSAYTLEIPPFRRPKIGQVLIRSLLDRTIFVLGRAVVVAAPAGLLIWVLGAIDMGDTSLLVWLSQSLDPVAGVLGMTGAILLAMILGFPANELVIPLTLMILGSSAGIGGEETLTVTSDLLFSAGWTVKTAICSMVFLLFHWPCSTTCLTIYKETKSWKWTALAFVLPTVFGVVLCTLLNLLWH